jgi:hypothetical protein
MMKPEIIKDLTGYSKEAIPIFDIKLPVLINEEIFSLEDSEIVLSSGVPGILLKTTANELKRLVSDLCIPYKMVSNIKIPTKPQTGEVQQEVPLEVQN